MNKFIFTAAVAVALIFGAPAAGFAISGRGGGARGGGARGGAAMRPAAPRVSLPARLGGGPVVGVAVPRTGGGPVGTAVPRTGGGPVTPYYYRGGSGWPYYGAYGALGLGLYGYDNPLWYGPDTFAYPDIYDYPYPGADPDAPR